MSAAQRVSEYLEGYRELVKGGLHPDTIHSAWVGRSDTPYSLYVKDLEELVRIAENVEEAKAVVE